MTYPLFGAIRSTVAASAGPFALVACACVFMLGLSPRAQAQTVLEISAPPDRTIVSPGQAVSVSVSAPTGAALSRVVLAGERPLGLLELLPALPAQASVFIPPTSALRALALKAVGVAADGTLVESEPVLLAVERLDAPVEMGTESASMVFEAPGGELPILVWAKFADGSTLDASESTRVSYASSNLNVASVSDTGLVTALTAGVAEITIQYRLDSVVRRAVVIVTVPAATLEAVPSILSFSQQTVGVSDRRSVTLTNRSLGAIAISEVVGDGDYAAQSDCISLSPLEPGRSCTVDVTFTPSEAGERMGALEVSTSFYSTPVGVPLRGTGLGRQPSATSLRASVAPSVFGQPVTLTATVMSGSGTPATGTVRFAEGTTLLGTQPLVSGVAALLVAPEAPGNHSLTAVYDGSEAIAPSEATLVHVVNRAATSTALGASANPSILGSNVTFTTAVAVQAPGAGTPTGSVSLREGTTSLSSSQLTGGAAALNTATLPVGVHPLIAAYAGDSRFAESSATHTQRVVYQPSGELCRGEAGHTMLQPIRADGTSVFNQGRTVPAKFRVCDAAGRSIGTPGVVRDFRLTQVIAGTESNVNEAVPSTTPDTTFRWDASAEQWIFNIGTVGQAANKTYVYTVTLNDETTLSFRYGLR